jgi:prevent-host-death family protein
MGIAINLLKAPHIGVRDLKENLSRFLRGKDPLVITDHGQPVDVILPYADMMNLVEIIDEITDPRTVKTVLEGKKAIKSGAKGVAVSGLFRAVRAKRKG